ncbi:unknown [Clostridium sp. CAG:798]|jgi:hypothetical protein|nr:unknown [Clostridium sp. CAG:798]HBJ12026.1 hypothetical protein [Clostridiales bacterium]
MDIKNIALVRATNVIPVDGVVRPISAVPYLRKEKDTEFSTSMRDLLRRKGLLKEVDWTKPDEINKISKENTKTLEQYVPYNSDYNSMVLWSLNGLVPDDMNNTFSDKTCAIIDGLAEQIEQSEMVSLVPTDTAIKGNVNLSNKATILIDKDRYETLSLEEKDKLAKLNLNVTIFQGNLKEAVNEALIREGRYTAETLSLAREDDGYIKSDTSDEVRRTIRDVANERNIAQVLHWSVITGQNDELDKLENVKDDFENGCIVKDFYKRAFFEYLFSKMNIDNGTKEYALYFPDSSKYMEDLCDEIGRIGIDKYKSLVDEYNKSLEQLRETGKLPTPQQIVNSARENKKIDLVSMIEKHSNEDIILSSAIKTTEEKTRTGVMDAQMENFKLLITNERGGEPKGVEIE